MSPGVRATVFGCVAFVAIVMGMFVHNISRPHGLTDEQLQAQGIVVLPRPREISPFEFQGADGKPFTNANITGKWSLLYFGYSYCPDACPTTLSALAKAMPAVQKALSAQHLDVPVQVVFVSVDPDRDTVQRIHEYTRFFSPAFLGATSTIEKLAAMGTQVNVTFGKIPAATPDTYAVDHPTNLVVVNPNGHYHAFMRPPFTAQRLSTGLPGMIARF